ncbi:hypothetical protein [Roseiconus lacunae]|uniref:hypothetical protein n=1 Tax=Roseiconus lacunae TaxID=2605694 RepID=UPI0011F2E9DA|nr:hypothetical protein [Roseiconus lacunae]
MTFDQCVRLAAHIHNSCVGVDVIAVGRFVPPCSVKASTPWKISIAIDGADKPVFIENDKDLMSVMDRYLPKQNRTDLATDANDAPAGMLF